MITIVSKGHTYSRIASDRISVVDIATGVTTIFPDPDCSKVLQYVIHANSKFQLEYSRTVTKVTREPGQTVYELKWTKPVIKQVDSSTDAIELFSQISSIAKGVLHSGRYLPDDMNHLNTLELLENTVWGAELR